MQINIDVQTVVTRQHFTPTFLHQLLLPCLHQLTIVCIIFVCFYPRTDNESAFIHLRARSFPITTQNDHLTVAPSGSPCSFYNIHTAGIYSALPRPRRIVVSVQQHLRRKRPRRALFRQWVMVCPKERGITWGEVRGCIFVCASELPSVTFASAANSFICRWIGYRARKKAQI